LSKLNFTNIEKAFNQLSLRERISTLCALLICFFAVSYFLIFEPMLLQQVQAEKAIKISEQQEASLSNEITAIKLRLQKDPLQEVNEQIAFSKQTLAVLDKQLNKKLVKFILAQKMPIALTKVLGNSPGIKVESLISLPVTAVNSAQEGAAGQAAENIFYKHTLEMKLTGSYNAIYQYLLNLEALQEKFYWSSLSYQVSDYPLANVTIQIYTLSAQKDLVSG